MTLLANGIEAGATGYDLGPIERIPLGEGRRCRVGSENVAVFRMRTGDVHAVQADCPHRGGPLEDGLTGAGNVVCPLHARAFDLTTGEAIRHTCDALRTYPVEITPDGTLRVYLPEAALQACPQG